jgi:hypothetical protein
MLTAEDITSILPQSFDKRYTPCFKCWPTGGVIVRHLLPQPKRELTRGVKENPRNSFCSLAYSPPSSRWRSPSLSLSEMFIVMEFARTMPHYHNVL